MSSCCDSNKKTKSDYYICEDIIAEIFERLPVKSLLRFRSLSKSWCECISSRVFIRRHTIKSPEKYIFKHEIWNENNDLEDIYTLRSEDRVPLCPKSGYIDRTAIKPPGGHPEWVGTCDGILCMFDHETRGISLWNYSIRRKLNLPDHPLLRDSTKSLAFGFGFNPITDDYKFVGISYSKYEGGAQSSFLYSMKTHSWSEIIPPATMFFDIKLFACCFNGVLHWVMKYKETELSTKFHRTIMTFNLNTHVFSRNSLPKLSCETKSVTVLSNCLFVVSRIGDDFRGSAWREDNSVGSWSVVKKACVALVDVGCPCRVEAKAYVESLELLDKGTPCGETIIHLIEKTKEEKENILDASIPI